MVYLKPWYIFYDPLGDVGFFLDNAKYFPIMGAPTYHYSPFLNKVIPAPCLNEPRWLYFGLLSILGYNLGFDTGIILFTLFSWSFFFIMIYYLASEFVGEKWALLSFPLVATFWINAEWFTYGVSEALGYPLFILGVLILIKHKNPLLASTAFVLAGITRWHLLVLSIPMLFVFFLVDRRLHELTPKHDRHFLLAFIVLLVTLIINDNLSLYLVGHVPYYDPIVWLVKGGGLGAGFVHEKVTYNYLLSLRDYFRWVGWQAAHLLGLGFIGMPLGLLLTNFKSTSWIKLSFFNVTFLLFPAILNPIQFGGYHHEFYILGFSLLSIGTIYFIKTFSKACLRGFLSFLSYFKLHKRFNLDFVKGSILLAVLLVTLYFGVIPQIQGFQKIHQKTLDTHISLRIIGDEFVHILETDPGDYYILDEYPWTWFYYKPTSKYGDRFYSTWDLTYDALERSRYVVIYNFQYRGGWLAKGFPESLLKFQPSVFYLFRDIPGWRTKVVVEPYHDIVLHELHACIYRIVEVQRVD